MLPSTYNEFLQKAGLTEKEALVYEALLTNGTLTVTKLCSLTNLKRGDLYNILYALRDKGLIEQLTNSKVASFAPCDPHILKQQIHYQRLELEQAEALAENLLPSLVSQYNLSQNKPSIRYFEGMTGLGQVYEELFNSESKELLLLRSVYDNLAPDIATFIDEVVEKQQQHGIHVKIIAPLEEHSRRRYLITDKTRGIERRITEAHYLQLPAEILLWGNCVAIVSLRKNIVATVIENPDIVETFRLIFRYMWEKAETYHQQITQEWQKSSD